MKFQLRDIEVKVFLGTDEAERAQKQKILVSVTWQTDTRKAEVSDDLADTVSYFSVREFVKNFSGEQAFHLLEKFHRELLDALAEQFPKAGDLELKIQKFPFFEGSVIVSN